ncbi:hypothetical protein AAZX31_02G059300 [Glycine max]
MDRPTRLVVHASHRSNFLKNLWSCRILDHNPQAVFLNAQGIPTQFLLLSPHGRNSAFLLLTARAPLSIPPRHHARKSLQV